MDTLPYISVQQWFEERVRAAPESAAVTFEEQTLTCGEINRRANQLARRLEKVGVGPEKVVAICMERSFDLIVALLGILKAGGVYLPVDPALPRERQAVMLDDAQPTVLITGQLLEGGFPTVAAPVFVLDRERAALESESGEDAPGRVTGKNLAYVMYTSGSTGAPKGVEISHEALVNLLLSMKERPGLTARDVLVAVTTLSFDIAGLEIFLPLVTGARLVFLSRDDASDGFRLLHHLTANDATVLQATPSTWRMLLEAKWPGNPQFKMLCGGEALPRELADQLLARGGELWNMYGPTETTIWSAAARVERDDAPINIGEPVANTLLYILDPHLQPVPMGVTGELHIGGLGLARGYRNRPELTAEKFIPDPFSREPGARLYKTGDVARLRAKGQIEVLGRLDHQVKIRGFRIELGEIEARLMQHPLVNETVVVAREDTPGRKQLAAYVVTKTDPSGQGAAPADRLEHWRGQWEMLFQTALAASSDRATALKDFDKVVTSWTEGERTAEEAQEWLECSLGRIRALKPRCVLEIGCGSGQLLLRLASEIEEYWGVDYAQAAVDALDQHLKASGLARPEFRLFVRPADQLEGIPSGRFDTVIINSVAQYFPDAPYLIRVIEQALRAAAPGGRVYIGDLQSYSLLECYHTGARLRRALPGQTATELRQLIAQRMAHENELVVDPPFFKALQAQFPAIGRLESQLRSGKLQNEITRYHYDMTLHLGEGGAVRQPGRWRDGKEISLEGIAAVLAAHPAETVGFRGVPNARLQGELCALQALQAAADQTKATEVCEALKSPESGIDPDDLWKVGAAQGRVATVLPNLTGSLTTVDVVFGPVADDGPGFVPWEGAADRPPIAYANQPFFEAKEKPLVTELRDFLEQSLPDYMVPAFFEVLPALPKTPNGKINRKALPRPGSQSAKPDKPYVAPRNPVETKLAEIWQQVLGREKVGIHDNIFEIGGDSLLIFQITARANQGGLPLSLRQVFQLRTIAELAAALPTTEVSPVPVAAAITAVSREAFRRPRPDVATPSTSRP